jgi:hypothetical protein
MRPIDRGSESYSIEELGSACEAIPTMPSSATLPHPALPRERKRALKSRAAIASDGGTESTAHMPIGVAGE